jgi:ATP-dependent exoDNAse (exonuclease V) alpha subunit
LINNHGAAWLTEVYRQRSDWQKKATSDLAEGRVFEAVQGYARQGCVTNTSCRDSAITDLTEDYLIDRASNPAATRLILAHRRRDVHALNQSVRETLKATGALEPGPLLSTEHGKRELAPTDRIVFTANDRDLGVKNGMLGTVKSASMDKVVVDLDDGGRESFAPCQFQAFDHGYAVTIHKSQGATVDQSYVLASRRMDDPLAYVAMTRHRDAMQLYVSQDDRPKWAQSFASQTRHSPSQTLRLTR